jgi:hypothetical protein
MASSLGAAAGPQGSHEATIADFIRFDGPAFLEVMIDPDAGVYPMVGPGATYAQMITGDHIAVRRAPLQYRHADRGRHA